MKTRIFKLIALVALVGLIMVSCKKSSGGSNSNGVGPSSTYYIKFSVNGTAMIYNYFPLGSLTDTTGYGSNNLFALVEMQAFNADTIPGTNFGGADLAVFSDSAAINTNTTYNADSTSGNYAQFDFGNANNIDDGTDYLANPSFKLNFSSITTTTMQGTFSGNVGDSNGDVIPITNGSFYIPRNQ